MASNVTRETMLSWCLQRTPAGWLLTPQRDRLQLPRQQERVQKLHGPKGRRIIQRADPTFVNFIRWIAGLNFDQGERFVPDLADDGT